MSHLTNRTAEIWKLWRKADAEVHRTTGLALHHRGDVQEDVLVKRTRDHARAIDQRVAILRQLNIQTGEAILRGEAEPMGFREHRELWAAD